MTNPIRRYREQKQLTQAEVGLLVAVSQPSVALWEAGGVRPTRETVKGLSAIFKVEVEVLEKELDEFYKKKREELRQRLGCQAKGRPRTS